jgi:signal peptidase I
MHPYLENGDYIIIIKKSTFTKGDVIVFDNIDRLSVKRIVGVPGENFKAYLPIKYYEMRDSLIFTIPHKGFALYNKDFHNFYWKKSLLKKLVEQNEFENVNKSYQTSEKVIYQDDYYYVLGDNPALSFDSRNFGLIPSNSIKGKYLFTIW